MTPLERLGLLALHRLDPERAHDLSIVALERGLAPLSHAGRPRRGRTRKRLIRKTSLSMVFDMLVRAARRGEPCPTNDELAAACRLSGKMAASYRMRRLVADGQIAVEDHSPFGRRVVTILTGPHAGVATIEAPL